MNIQKWIDACDLRITRLALFIFNIHQQRASHPGVHIGVQLVQFKVFLNVVQKFIF